MNFKKIFLGFSSLLLFISCAQKAVETSPISEEQKTLCPINGHSVNWLTNYCMIKSGVDDKYSKIIHECITDMEKPNEGLDECAKRRLYKKQICELEIKLGRIKTGLIACTEDTQKDPIWGQLK